MLFRWLIHVPYMLLRAGLSWYYIKICPKRIHWWLFFTDTSWSSISHLNILFVTRSVIHILIFFSIITTLIIVKCNTVQFSRQTVHRFCWPLCEPKELEIGHSFPSFCTVHALESWFELVLYKNMSKKNPLMIVFYWHIMIEYFTYMYIVVYKINISIKFNIP
jgi:hypothetical protein